MNKKVDVIQILEKIKIMVCLDHNYKYTDHVIRYIEKGKCSFDDIEFCIKNAKTIHGIEKDTYGDSTDGMLYKILGKTKLGQLFYTTGKFKKAINRDEYYFFITAHEIKK